MTKKKASVSTQRHLPRLLGTKLLIFVGVLLCILALLRHHFQSKLHPSLAKAKKSRTLHDEHFEGPPKIAFLFLVRHNLPLDFLWDTFFKNSDRASFSIYIHSEPNFVFDETTTRSDFFYGRQLKNSIPVVWGESSMVQAERLLIEEALRDPGNQRFILLSDSCVPLYNFSYIYNYVMSSPESFVDSFSNPKDGRYNPKMSPVIPKEKWRKGSQWITLIRRHATIVVDDDIVFPVFEKYCKSWAAIGLRKGRKILGIDIKFPIQMPRLLKHGNCIPDEHYVQTLLEMSEALNELERRTLTYTSWDQSAVRGTRKSWHPVTLTYSDVTPEQVAKIKDINQVYYKSERRTEWCQANSKFTSCFLFARKFTTGAAVRLLTEGFIGPFNVYSSQS